MAGVGAAMRNEVVAYLNTGASFAVPTFTLMGTGFDKLDDELNPVEDSVTYVHEATATTTLTGYEAAWSFDATVIKDDAAVTKLRGIGKSRATGANAQCDIVTYDVWDVATGTVPAVRQKVAVVMDNISNGAGGEKLGMSGTLKAVGDPIPGTFTVATKAFVAT